jgi:hypothetical protein
MTTFQVILKSRYDTVAEEVTVLVEDREGTKGDTEMADGAEDDEGND